MPASEATPGPPTGLVLSSLHHTAPQGQGHTWAVACELALCPPFPPQAAVVAAEVNRRNSNALWPEERMC